MVGHGTSSENSPKRSMVEFYPEYVSMIHGAALKYAAKGVPVFPLHSLDDAGVCTCGGPQVNPKCSPAKHPRTLNGFKDATTDPRKITAWWTRWPEANIGIPTGKSSGLAVVDLDAYKPGSMTVEEFEERYGTISNTTTVRTGSGGLQLYFRYPDGAEIRNSAGLLGAHVDVRAEGGYVVAPGSVTTARYEWINKAAPTPIPPKLLKALTDKPRNSESPGRTRPSTMESIVDAGGPIPSGARNHTLTSEAGRLHDGTRDEDQLVSDLLATNEARCIPPLPASEVQRIARSVYRYEPCRPARREPDAQTVAALAVIERELLAREHRGQGGKTSYSICVALLKLARQHGELVEDGVRLQVSARQLALAAAVSRRTIANKLKTMTELLRPDNEGIEPGKAGAIVLLLPRATFHHSTHRASSDGGCAKRRAPFTAPRLRWSSPPRRPRRGVTPGTSRVRDGIISKKRDAVVRLGKSCESIMDRLEAAGGSMMLSDLADAVDVKRPRDLTRRKNLETGKGRDGFVTRLQDVGVLTVDGDTVGLCEDWLEALDQERERAGEVALYRRDMAQYNRERTAYRDRHKVKADPAPSEEEMREAREGYPARRREGIEAAIVRLFREHPEYRGRRAGQITCRLMFYLPDDFPRGALGAPKDLEVEQILDGVAA